MIKKNRNLSLGAKLSHLHPSVRTAIDSYIQRIAQDCANDVLFVTLYGSQARGDATSESDIDLLVVIRNNRPDLLEKLTDLAWQVQFEHNVVISDVIRDREQFRKMQSMRFPYIQSIEREGIVLWKIKSEPMPSFA